RCARRVGWRARRQWPAGPAASRGGGGATGGEALAFGQLRAAGDLLAVGLERLLHRDDGDLDLVVRRTLRRDHLDEDPGRHERLDDGIVPVLPTEPEDLVADRRD